MRVNEPSSITQLRSPDRSACGNLILAYEINLARSPLGLVESRMGTGSDFQCNKLSRRFTEAVWLQQHSGLEHDGSAKEFYSVLGICRSTLFETLSMAPVAM